jgi:hypothetical protein
MFKKFIIFFCISNLSVDIINLFLLSVCVKIANTF